MNRFVAAYYAIYAAYRPVLYGMAPPLAFVLGVCLLQRAAALPSLWLAAAIPFLCAAFHVCCQLQNKPIWTHAARALLLLIFLLSGFFYAAWRADIRLAPQLDAQWYWKDIAVEGIVINQPETNARRTRFRFNIEQMINPQTQATLTLDFVAQLSDYHRQPSALIRKGARLKLTVRIRPPRISSNPHDFDYARYLFTQDIAFVGYVRNRNNIESSAPQDESTATNLTWREALHERIRNSGAPLHHLIAALVVGVRGEMSDDDWTLLRRTGTSHLFSISGLHIGYVFLLVGWLAAFLWRLPFIYSHLPRMRFATLIALPCAFAYALISGFGVPVQRSFLMVFVGAVFLVWGANISARTVLALVMMAVVLINPWAVLASGFWLSFVFVAIIYFIAINQPLGQPVWQRLLKGQCLISFFAIPLTLWFFNEASLVSPLANVVAIPIIGMVVLPLSLLGVVAGDWCWWLAGWLMQQLWDVLAWMSAWKYAAWSPASAPVALFIIAAAGLAWMLMPRGIPYRYLGALPVLAVLLYTGQPPAVGNARVVVFDVGQGTAVIVRTNQHTLVYDTGRAWGGRVLADYLRGEGIDHLDKVIISHDNDDHNGGLPYLKSAIPMSELWTHDSEEKCLQGNSWQWDSVQFSVLHPTASTPSQPVNDTSCVVHLQTASGLGLLLTGDISVEVEQQLLSQLSPTTALLVAHHGSKTSTDPRFIKATSPSIAIISVGADNRYGHPHASVLETLRAQKIYRTDHDGAIVMDFADTLTTIAWRKQHNFYWHNR